MCKADDHLKNPNLLRNCDRHDDPEKQHHQQHQHEHHPATTFTGAMG